MTHSTSCGHHPALAAAILALGTSRDRKLGQERAGTGAPPSPSLRATLLLPWDTSSLLLGEAPSQTSELPTGTALSLRAADTVWERLGSDAHTPHPSQKNSGKLPLQSRCGLRSCQGYHMESLCRSQAEKSSCSTLVSIKSAGSDFKWL